MKEILTTPEKILIYEIKKLKFTRGSGLLKEVIGKDYI